MYTLLFPKKSIVIYYPSSYGTTSTQFCQKYDNKWGSKSLPDRLFVQEYLSAYTYPDIMEIIRSLFLNYFATLRIPLTLHVICRIISLAI